MATLITKDNFEAEVLQSDLPVLVDFYADWCGPCKMMSPVVEKAAEEYAGKCKVCKCNVDNSPAIAVKYNVISIPTFKIFKAGECVATKVGGMNGDDFYDWIDEAL